MDEWTSNWGPVKRRELRRNNIYQSQKVHVHLVFPVKFLYTHKWSGKLFNHKVQTSSNPESRVTFLHWINKTKYLCVGLKRLSLKIRLHTLIFLNTKNTTYYIHSMCRTLTIFPILTAIERNCGKCQYNCFDLFYGNIVNIPLKTMSMQSRLTHTKQFFFPKRVIR